MNHLLAILTLVFSLAACAGYGYAWLRLVSPRKRRDPLRPCYAVALGMGTLAYLILGAGLVGWLHPPVLGLLTGAGILLLIGEAWQHRRAASSLPADVTGRDPEGYLAPEAEARTDPAGSGPIAGRDPEHLLALALWAANGLLALATLVSALHPPDGLDWDSLSYHLAAPKIYLREGRIGFIAYDSHTHFPFTMEMLYTLGLQFGGVGGAKLFHWAAGWLTALAVGLWSSRLTVGGLRAPRWTGPLAAALFAGMPIVLWEMGTAYVDLGTALFQLLALAALVNAVTREEGITLRDAALAGILSGFALGTKMTALLQFGLLGLGLLAWAGRTAAGGKVSRRSAVQAVLMFGLAGLVVGSPWYIKSWLWTHNPVYPFFYSFFPDSYSWTREAEIAYATEQASFGRGRGPDALLLALWNLGMHGRDFYINYRSLVGDQIGTLGPVWAGLVPLLFWARGLDRRAWLCLLYFGGSLGFWFLLSHQSRYLVPIFAPLAVVVALGVAALTSRWLRIAAGVFVALSLLLSVKMHAPLAQTSALVVTGVYSEDEYLRASLPGLYEASLYVNQLPSDTRVALYQETRGFYIDRNYFWANPLQHNLIPYDRLKSGAELMEWLRRFGNTHVLINYGFSKGTEASQWYRLLMDAIENRRLVESYRSRGVVVYEIR